MPTIPKNIHVSIVGPAEGWELSFLAIWANVNPDYKIHLWAPELLAYRKILYSLLISEINKDAIEKDSPDEDIARLKDNTWKKIDDFMGESTTVEQLNILRSSFSDNVKQSFTIQWDKTNEMLNKIEISIDNIDVHRTMDNFKPKEIQYINYSLSFTNTLLTERFLGLHSELDLGGAYIDKGVLPELNIDFLTEAMTSLGHTLETPLTDERKSQIERAVIRALSEKMFSDGIIQDPSPYFETYDKNLPEQDIRLVKSIIEKTSIDNLFQRLGEYHTTDHTINRVFLGVTTNLASIFFGSTLDNSNQPMVLISRSKNALVKISLNEIVHIHDAVKDFKQLRLSEKEFTAKIREVLIQFYDNNKVKISGDDINKVAMMSTQLSYDKNEADYHIITKLAYGSFERLQKIQMQKRPVIVPFHEFSTNNPFYNRKSYDLLFKPSQIVRRRLYDKLIVINFSLTLQNNREYLIKSTDLYDGYRTQDSVLYNVVIGASGRGELKLETVKGIPFTNIGEDTKVIITGTVHFFEYSSHSSSRAEHVTKTLSSILRMAIPRDTTVQNIAFYFYNSAQGLVDSVGVLDASHKLFVVPGVLRELAKTGIHANYAVAVTAAARPSTSIDALYPEPNRIVFTLRPDKSTVEYRLKFGLASLEAENLFTYVGTEGQSDDVMSEDDPIKAILQEKIAGSG
ncbi:hypothetical protein, partial [Endozoicomonas sp. ONNA1]|uniref:hypothetical protein n=2 Tax=unclassified Endozoicomonas TaxID=2644528 RepID=UPI00214896F8